MEAQRQIYPNSFSVISIQEHIFILSCTNKTRHIMAKVLCSPIKKSNHRILLICPNRTKQEVHGPHCSPEKQFTLLSVNTFAQSFDYTITLIKREKNLYLFLRILKWSFLCIINIFSLFSYLSPNALGPSPSFDLTFIPFTQVCFVPGLIEIGSMVLD